MTCTVPLRLSFKWSHYESEKCGEPAVGKLSIGISGQLATFFLCEKHANWTRSKEGKVEPL